MSDAVTQTGGQWQETRAYKFFAYVAGTILALLASIITDGITRAEWGQLLIAAVTAGTVWATANLPRFPKLKEIVAVVLTLANLGNSYITGQVITGAEWVNLGILAAAVVGVIAINNPVATKGAVAPHDQRGKRERGAGEARTILLTAAGVLLALIVWALLVAVFDGNNINL